MPHDITVNRVCVCSGAEHGLHRDCSWHTHCISAHKARAVSSHPRSTDPDGCRWLPQHQHHCGARARTHTHTHIHTHTSPARVLTVRKNWISSSASPSVMVRRGFGASRWTEEALRRRRRRLWCGCNGCLLPRSHWAADILRGRGYADERAAAAGRPLLMNTGHRTQDPVNSKHFEVGMHTNNMSTKTTELSSSLWKLISAT